MSDETETPAPPDVTTEDISTVHSAGLDPYENPLEHIGGAIDHDPFKDYPPGTAVSEGTAVGDGDESVDGADADEAGA